MGYLNLPNGVRIAGSDPIDADRYIATDIAQRDLLIPNGRAKESQQCYVEADQTLYILKGATNADWETVGGGAIGVGTPGQILATDAAGTGIEWIDDITSWTVFGEGSAFGGPPPVTTPPVFFSATGKNFNIVVDITEGTNNTVLELKVSDGHLQVYESVNKGFQIANRLQINKDGDTYQLELEGPGTFALKAYYNNESKPDSYINGEPFGGTMIPNGVYYRKANETHGSSGGLGYVVGPSDSMDGTLPMFDGLTGKLIKDSHLVPGTAVWNANKLQSVNVSATTPTDTQVLTYNASIPAWEPKDAGGGGGGDDLQAVTDAGNTTTNEIKIVDNKIDVDGVEIISGSTKIYDILKSHGLPISVLSYGGGDTSNPNFGFGNSLSTNTGKGVISIGLTATYSNTGDSLIAINGANRNTGDSCIAIGENSLKSNSGNSVTGVGIGALYGNTGQNALGLGITVGFYNKGLNNTFLGYYSGHNGSSSAPENSFANLTLLGANTKATKSNQVTLGDPAIESIRTMNDNYGVTVPLGDNDLITKKYADTNYSGGGDFVGKDKTSTTTQIDNIWTGTQAEYNALTPVATTLYFII